MRRPLIKLLYIVLYLAVISSPAMAQTSDEQDDSPEQQSLQEEWSEVILYGIDSNVVELVSTLSDRSDPRMNTDLAERFRLGGSREMRVKILDHLREFEDPALENEALDILLYFYEHHSGLIKAAIQYLGSIELDARQEASELLQELVHEDNSAYSSQAVRALADIGSPDAAAFFLGVLADDIPVSGNLREAILLALGDTGDAAAVDALVDILADDAQPLTQRQFAADSLGKIGDPRALPALKEALESDENMLRAYAVSALGRFPDEDTTDILLQALRDSFWRTREVALDGVAEGKLVSALPAVRYMAENDPEGVIRRKAVTTMVELDTQDGWEFINTRIQNDRTPRDQRLQMLQLAIEHNLDGSREVIREVMESEWDENESALLNAIGKTMSTTENPDLAPFYERMLDHSNFIIRMYGVRGIARNGLSEYRERIESFTEEGHAPALQREARSGLEDL